MLAPTWLSQLLLKPKLKNLFRKSILNASFGIGLENLATAVWLAPENDSEFKSDARRDLALAGKNRSGINPPV